MLSFFVAQLLKLQKEEQTTQLKDLLTTLGSLCQVEDVAEYCDSTACKEKVKKVEQMLVVFEELSSRSVKKEEEAFRQAQSERQAQLERQFLRFEGSKESRALFRQNSERSGVMDIRQRLQKEQESRQNLAILFDVIARLRSSETSVWYRESRAEIEL